MEEKGSIARKVAELIEPHDVVSIGEGPTFKLCKERYPAKIESSRVLCDPERKKILA